MKFEVGQKVKAISKYNYFSGHEGTIERFVIGTYFQVHFASMKGSIADTSLFRPEEIELVTESEETLDGLFVAIQGETDEDPEFEESMIEVMKIMKPEWLKSVTELSPAAKVHMAVALAEDGLIDEAKQWLIPGSADTGFKEPYSDQAIRLMPGEVTVGGAIRTCTHTWKTYNGLTETFEYCENCDEKR